MIGIEHTDGSVHGTTSDQLTGGVESCCENLARVSFVPVSFTHNVEKSLGSDSPVNSMIGDWSPLVRGT